MQQTGCRFVFVFLALSLAACGGKSSAGGAPAAGSPAMAGDRDSGAQAEEVSPLADDAIAGIDDPALQTLLADHWEWEMAQSPEWATTLGDHRFDDRLRATSQADVDAARQRVRGFLARAKQLPTAEMSPADRLTLALFIDDLEGSIATEVCELHKWSVSAISNPVSGFNRLPERHKIVTERDAANLVARYRKIPSSIEDSIANLKAGKQAGLVANAESLRRAVEMVDGVLAKPTEEWALLDPLDKLDSYDQIGADARASFARDLRASVDAIRPAYQAYRDLLAELLAQGRSGNKIGIVALPAGAACYAAQIRNHTGLERTARELHELGLAEIARINKEMTVLGRRLFKTGKLDKITARMRTDRALYFKNKEEIVDAARQALDAARARIPDYFGVLPKADCVVTEIPDTEAPFSTIAYYNGPHYDGSKPGEYFINTYKPEVRPRFEMQVLAFHESIPGHHLQIAISHELPALPAFRKFGGSTAYVEGWALYTERLADEMRLYSGDLDRMGMLSYDAWRASRLVVDTGIHSMGWTREQAEKFMLAHTALTEANIENEVDRYISWPGQALAYKVGQLEILRLRAEAKESLGPRFDIKRFHDAVLENGAVTLPVLAERIAAWIEAEKTAVTR